jgi:hypothetical protein
MAFSSGVVKIYCPYLNNYLNLLPQINEIDGVTYTHSFINTSPAFFANTLCYFLDESGTKDAILTASSHDNNTNSGTLISGVSVNMTVFNESLPVYLFGFAQNGTLYFKNDDENAMRALFIEAPPEPEPEPELEPEPEPEPEPVAIYTPGELDTTIAALSWGSSVRIRGYYPSTGRFNVIEYDGVVAAPVGNMVSYQNITISSIPISGYKVVVGLSYDNLTGAIYFFLRMYDSSDIRIQTFSPPISITLALSEFSGETVNVTHLDNGEPLVGIRIAPGVYQCLLSTNSEYQVFDGAMNAIVGNGVNVNTRIDLLLYPANSGTFYGVMS